jgi:hypothetical protein
MPAASLQCSLQYFPKGPLGATVQLQAGRAHFAVFMASSWRNLSADARFGLEFFR